MSGNSTKLRIGVLYGGRSEEHDVSIMSATNVMSALDPDKYEAVPIFVTRDGKWILSSFEDGRFVTPTPATQICLLAGGGGHAMALPATDDPYEFAKIDILFPVLHGLHGEDGAAQGLAEVACVPFAGCGIAGSANALDKDLAKRLFLQAGLPTAKSLTIFSDAAPSFAELEEALGLPAFIKPARQGSSVGVSKVSSQADYEAALQEGFRHDSKLLAEEFIDGREIECGVLEEETGALFVSRTGEIAPSELHGFYSYDAKYVDADGAVLKVPSELPAEIEDRIRDLALRAFRALGCDGMARVDFFLTADGRILINELNTIPGFTDISMYSKVMAVSGISYPEVIDRLVLHGLARAGRDI
ncbi:D-alanine--D-alanine ligase [Rhodobacterales bacterium]|nr:D-alanine--D-alanine ligase [Rhodobacterales bacterium]